MSNSPIQPISPLWSVFPSDAPKAVSASQGGSFVDIFQSAIENVKETNAEKSQMEYLLAIGELDNPALVGIASSKAAAATELLMQLRNKSLEAYSELMRINL